MATLRNGAIGDYYGSTFSESEPLSQSEMNVNADYILRFFILNGWTTNAVCALLGNMQAESTLNPGRWQSDNVVSTSNVYGVVQWTPSTKYSDWCSENGYSDPSEMDHNLFRIRYEVKNGVQWISRTDYPLSFDEFSKSGASIDYLAKAFLLCYERPADQSESVQNYRSELAYAWFTYLEELYGGSIPDNPSVPTPINKRKSKYNFILLNSRKRRETWIR
jgi:hypothetical protein